jgi:hypothetical protein
MEREWCAWLGAMIDAEGYISFSDLNGRGYPVTVGFTQMNQAVVDKYCSLLAELGCNYAVTKTKVRMVRVRDRDSILKLLIAIEPWLIRLSVKAVIVRFWLERRGPGRPSLNHEDHALAKELRDMIGAM